MAWMINPVEKLFQKKWLLAGVMYFSALWGFAEQIALSEGLPLFYWNEKWRGRVFVNFGDYLSLKLVERIVGRPLRSYVDPLFCHR
jgi:hypothetical protein